MRITEVVLFSALWPHIDKEKRLRIGWGERFLDGWSRHELRRRCEYQGSNIPIGASSSELARYRHASTRFRP